MLEHRTPFDSIREGEDPGSATIARELIVTPVRDKGLLLLQSACLQALQTALEREIGLRLPPAQQASWHGPYVLLWQTPAQWLLQLPARECDSIGAALSDRLASALAAITDFSDALVALEVGGAGLADVFMSGCSLDLRADAFPPGRVARTSLADVPAILWNPGGSDRIHCLIERGFETHLFASLKGTATR